jgi:extracellular elastinolytic metalloproteinase
MSSLAQFYRGAAPTPFTNPASAAGVDAHAVYCDALSSHIEDQIHSQFDAGSQTVLQKVELNPVLSPLHAANCFSENQAPLPSAPDSISDIVMDPRHALLQFMALATPSDSVLQDIQSRFHEHVAAMTSTFETKVTGSHSSPVELIENVPDAVAPVKTTLAYVQVPHGDEVVLSLVWRVSTILSLT